MHKERRIAHERQSEQYALGHRHGRPRVGSRISLSMAPTVTLQKTWKRGGPWIRASIVVVDGQRKVKDGSCGGMRRWSDRQYALLAARWSNVTQPMEGTRVGIFSSVCPGNGANAGQRGAGMEDVDE